MDEGSTPSNSTVEIRRKAKNTENIACSVFFFSYDRKNKSKKGRKNRDCGGLFGGLKFQPPKSTDMLIIR